MILDNLVNADKYAAIHPHLALGFKFLKDNDLLSMEPGKYEIQGTDVFAIVQEYETLSSDKGKWESHYEYTDIQYIVSGTERIGYAHVDRLQLTEEHPDKDVKFHEGAGDVFEISGGTFAVFGPEDAHMPSLMKDEASLVRKVVVKVAMG